ncbi:unnamed protein product, partial [Symbiodinium sp. KB8]
MQVNVVSGHNDASFALLQYFLWLLCAFQLRVLFHAGLGLPLDVWVYEEGSGPDRKALVTMPWILADIIGGGIEIPGISTSLLGSGGGNIQEPELLISSALNDEVSIQTVVASWVKRVKELDSLKNSSSGGGGKPGDALSFGNPRYAEFLLPAFASG